MVKYSKEDSYTINSALTDSFIRGGTSLKTTPLELVPAFIWSCNNYITKQRYDLGDLTLVAVESLLDMVGYLYMSPTPPQKANKSSLVIFSYSL